MRPTIVACARVATRGRRPPPALPPTAYPSAFPSSPSSSSSSSSSFSPSASASGLSESINAETIAQAGGSSREGWYHVNRSEGGKLPVYSKIRNGGSITTLIRKVDTLQSQLTTYLSDLHIDPFTHPPKVTVRPTNNHLQIKGHWVDEVKGWLEGRGF
ncbi:uncharacterized protein IL334_002807 [Kwoniella shivajii]|uniref:Large ribosomal subunit protein mL49 n=1 Tax=Kwoniella shivajii TaxID=564305 RepID=A0ABZ1CYT1_9TREE|nr:hypothetical protein IL334_002807 [Kwoniella shivajii]